MEMTVRSPAVAGAFYPESKKELRKTVDSLLRYSSSESPPGGQVEKSDKDSSRPRAKSRGSNIKRLRAIVVPHAGYIYSGIVAASGFNLIKNQNLKEPRILLMGPSHHIAFDGLATSSFKKWETPLGKVEIDLLNFEMSHKYHKDVICLDAAHIQEHCLEVEIPFLQEVFLSFSLIPLITGEGDPEKFSSLLADFEKSIDLFIVSSDLSHYYPYEVARMLDARANEAIPNLNIKKTEEEVEACGKQGILTIMHLAKMKNWQGVFVDYKNSGDTAGDKSAVVGYGVYAFYDSTTSHSE